MRHDLTKTVLGRKKISLEMPNEVRAWCDALQITEAELRFAVSKVGNSVNKVREYLRSSASPSSGK